MENIDYNIIVEKKIEKDAVKFIIKKNAIDELDEHEMLGIYNKTGANLVKLKQQLKATEVQIKLSEKDFEVLRPFAEEVRKRMEQEIKDNQEANNIQVGKAEVPEPTVEILEETPA